uniref:Uncharacterized protein n=1 Tax=Phlebotomus papatasi TaxID=29031 RepID=A0A1B0DF64_PHLPP
MGNFRQWYFFITGTPILTRRLTMRRETIRALEVRKNSIMAERRKSQMQTLGANNEYGITTSNNMNNNLGVPPPRNHRTSNAGINVKELFDVNGGPAQPIYGTTTGQVNQAYEPVIDEEDRNSLRLTPRNQVSWSNSTDRRL